MGRMCSCPGCGKFTRHYANGRCRNCYTVMLRHGFTDINQLLAYKEGKREHSEETKAKKEIKIELKQKLKVTTCNEFRLEPRSEISQRIFDWYYNNTDKYLVFDCNKDERLRKNVYNTAYAMTKRRHSLNIKRHQRNGNIILERVSA